jgi:hypothetical protein
MAAKRRREDKDVLREHWNRLTTVIALFAERRPARRRLDPRAYSVLHKDLIAVCRSLARAEADEERRSYYARLAEMVQPWLSLRVLARTDGEILSELLRHCREINDELSGKWRTLRIPRHSAPVLVIAACGAAVLGVAWGFQVIGLPVIETLRGAAETTWFAIRFAEDLHRYSVIAVILILISMYIVSRSTRASPGG